MWIQNEKHKDAFIRQILVVVYIIIICLLGDTIYLLEFVSRQINNDSL